jgi:translation initiation factor 2 subunit 1
LSKRRVSAEDVIKCEDRYNKSKTVHTIMRHVAEKTGKDMDEVNEMIAWPLYNKFGHAHEAFKLSISCVFSPLFFSFSHRSFSFHCFLPVSLPLLTLRSLGSEPETVFGALTIPSDVLDSLRSEIARRLTPQPVKIRADLEVTNFSYNGILTIQEALAAGEALSTPEIPIKIRLVAPPLYVMVSNTTDKQGAIERLELAIEAIQEVIKKEEGGHLHVKMKPKAVSETDDLELQALMEKVAKENAEVEGDSDSENGASTFFCSLFLTPPKADPFLSDRRINTFFPPSLLFYLLLLPLVAMYTAASPGVVRIEQLREGRGVSAAFPSFHASLSSRTDTAPSKPSLMSTEEGPRRNNAALKGVFPPDLALPSRSEAFTRNWWH